LGSQASLTGVVRPTNRWGIQLDVLSYSKLKWLQVDLLPGYSTGIVSRISSNEFRLIS